LAHWEFDVHDWPTTNKQVSVAWSHALLAAHCDDKMQLFDVVVGVVVDREVVFLEVVVVVGVVVFVVAVVVFVEVEVGVVILGVVAPWHWAISNAITKQPTCRSL